MNVEQEVHRALSAAYEECVEDDEARRRYAAFVASDVDAEVQNLLNLDADLEDADPPTVRAGVVSWLARRGVIPS